MNTGFLGGGVAALCVGALAVGWAADHPVAQTMASPAADLRLGPLTEPLVVPNLSVAPSGDGARPLGPPEKAQQITSTTNQKFGVVLERAIWRFSPGQEKVIFVCWEDQGWSAEKALVRSSIEQTWQAKSGLRFRGWSSCQLASQGIRIAIADDGPHVKALGQLLNAMPRGMVLNFSFRTWSPECQMTRDYCIKTIAVHEFGHAIGLAHEHNRPDTPGECREKPQGTDGDVHLTSYDPDSVMNYCNESYNNNGTLSQRDEISVAAMYCRPEVPRCAPPIAPGA